MTTNDNLRGLLQEARDSLSEGLEDGGALEAEFSKRDRLLIGRIDAALAEPITEPSEVAQLRAENEEVRQVNGGMQMTIDELREQLAERDESLQKVRRAWECTLGHEQLFDVMEELSASAEPAKTLSDNKLLVSLVRGSASNEEPRVRHSCSMGVGCEEAGACFAAANGEPDRCGMPAKGGDGEE